MDQIDSQLLIENLEAAIIVVDRDLLVQRVNISTETLFEQSRRYLIGKPIAEMIGSSEVVRCIKEVLSHNAQYTLREISIALPSREALLDMTMSVISGQQGVSSSALIEMRSINRITRFMKEKNQFEKQQSFRLMMRGLAHEIKNPLGGIRGAAQLLHREIDDPEQQELANILIKEADRLTRLVDRVMGSRNKINLEKINVHEVLEHVTEILAARADSDLRVERAYDPTLPEILADKEALIQAVLNIVVNAIQAQEHVNNPAIGFVTQFERFVTINQVLHKRALKIQIWDNGPGVSAEYRDILFDPLITSRPEGSGLGLAIAQEIIQKHQGSIQLEEGEQSRFTIYLPYIKEANLPKYSGVATLQSTEAAA